MSRRSSPCREFPRPTRFHSWPRRLFVHHMDGLYERAFQADRTGLLFHQIGGRAADQFALMHQAYAIAALGLIEVSGGHEDGDAVLEQLIKNGPEIAARNRVD